MEQTDPFYEIGRAQVVAASECLKFTRMLRDNESKLAADLRSIGEAVARCQADFKSQLQSLVEFVQSERYRAIMRQTVSLARPMDLTDLAASIDAMHNIRLGPQPRVVPPPAIKPKPEIGFGQPR